ncbi:MAG TPA: MarR family transcriptional regulator [Gemmatimonadaceae bacterium]
MATRTARGGGIHPKTPAAAAQPHSLADRLHSAAIHLLRQLRKEDDASGLSAPRLSALSVVVFGGPLTLGELARAEQVKPPTMTRIVTGLEKDGLVERKDDPRDKRLTHVEATSKGRKVLAAGRARRVQRLASAVGKLEGKQLADLDRGVQLLREVIMRMRGEQA